jgi:hypothetical protein
MCLLDDMWNDGAQIPPGASSRRARRARSSWGVGQRRQVHDVMRATGS